nr:hypothetical protein [Paracoccaceae bacterium]
AYNIGWSYHLDPSSVFFFEMSTEVGDSTMRYIEDHLPEIGGALLPGSVWTGWSSLVLDELAAKRGGGGGDRLEGTPGHDLLVGRAGDDLLLGRAGDDHLAGGRGTDRLRGGAGDDKLAGGRGLDRLEGGAGDDLLEGGAGADVFRFCAAGRSGRDAVRDFDGGAGDRLAFHRSWAEAVGDRTGDGRVDAGDLRAAFEAHRGDLVLRLDADTRVVLEGLAGRTLGSDDVTLF